MDPTIAEIIKALVIGLPSFGLGFLAYRRSLKVDKVANQVGLSSETRAGTQQIILGLNDLVDNLQEDNKALREEAKYLLGRITTLIAECEEVKRQLNAFQRKYGDLPA